MSFGNDTSIQNIINDFDEIIENKSAKRELVHQWKNIQNLLSLNGLGYEINFVSDSDIRPVYEEIKTAKQFRTKTLRNQTDTYLTFLSGHLRMIGGKNPNFHIVNNRDEKFTVKCNESQAMIVNKFLYSNINISCWCKKSEIESFSFCDIYQDISLYENFKVFIQNIELAEEADALIDIHNQIKTFLNNKDFNKLCKFINLFNHESVDVNILKTILVITKSFSENEFLQNIREEIKNRLELKLGLSLI